MADQTLGQHMLAEILPDSVYVPGQVIDKSSIKRIMGELARTDSDGYRKKLHDLIQLGKEVGVATGGSSFTVSHLATPPGAAARRDKLRKKIVEIVESLPPEKQRDAIVSLLHKAAETDKDETYLEAEAMHNPLADILKGAGRGNKASLARLIASDLMYAGSDGKPIPIPVLNSYSNGLTPGEYIASSFGARKGISESKLSVASGGFMCFTGDTEIRLADGSAKPISDVQPGEYVMGATMQGNTLPVKVLHRWENGLQPVKKYFLRLNGQRSLTELTATPGHEVLVIADAKVQLAWGQSPGKDIPALGEYFKCPIGDLHRKMRIAVSGPAMSWEGSQRESLAWVIGYLIGDGCLSNGKVRFATADPEVLATMRKRLEPIGFDIRRARKPAEGRVDYEYAIVDLQPYRDGVVVGTARYGIRHRLKSLLAQLGLMGKRAHEKTMPDLVRQWDVASVREFLSGLIEADGCVSTTHVGTQTLSLRMTSESVVQGVRNLLRDVCGIHASAVQKTVQSNAKVKSPKMPSIPKSNFPLFGIAVTGYMSLMRLYAQLPANGQKLISGREKFLAKSYGNRQKNSYGLVSCEDAGEATVYDLEVDHPDHLYVLGNGMIVSNSKLISSAAHRGVITDIDAEDDSKSLGRGLPVDTLDEDNVGALLAADVGPYKRNTALTPKIIAHLDKLGHDEILVRSPITSADPRGGVYARDVGERQNGLPQIGESVGITAAQSISEPITQSALSSKHSGGVATASKGLSGFDLIDRLLNTPKEFREAATYSDIDGKITKIEKADQGGHYIHVDGEAYYAGPDKKINVKVGQSVEAGDVLTDGPVNPRKVIEHKGLGEGARSLSYALRDAIRDSGGYANRRNIELIAKGLVDRVRITEEFDDYTPDEVVPYNQIMANWKPREGHRISGLQSVANRYLEQPILHYTVGTRITPSVVARLQKHGVKQIATHADPPPFRSEMVRAMDVLKTDSDWMTRQVGTSLTKSLLNSTHTGGISDEAGSSFVPGRARAVDFNRTGIVKLNLPTVPNQLGHQ